MDDDLMNEIIRLSNHKTVYASKIRSLIDNHVNKSLNKFHKEIMDVFIDSLEQNKSLDETLIIINNLKYNFKDALQDRKNEA